MTEGSDMKITPSSGNVFADLGLADADDLLAEADQLLLIRSANQDEGVHSGASTVNSL